MKKEKSQEREIVLFVRIDKKLDKAIALMTKKMSEDLGGPISRALAVRVMLWEYWQNNIGN